MGDDERSHVQERGLKARLFQVVSTRIPLVRETADPWIFLALVGLVLVTTVALIFPDTVFSGDEDPRTHVIQVAAGLLVILGAYFTAVNIREVRAHQSFERLNLAIGQLESDSQAVRIGAIRLLESVALEKLDLPTSSAGEVSLARRRAIREALEALTLESQGPSVVVAREVLTRLAADSSAVG
jgi:hypothetical protein